MTRRFAENTTVPVAKTRGEIEALLEKHGATKFASMYDESNAMIGFAMRGRLIKFTLCLPDRTDDRFVKDTRYSWKTASVDEQKRRYDQEARRIWRALLLVIKAKLEAVDSEIITFEQEFLPFIVMADGRTIGEAIIPQLSGPMTTQDLSRLLNAPGSKNVQ